MRKWLGSRQQKWCVIWWYGGTVTISVHLLKSPVASQASVFLFVLVGLQCAVSARSPADLRDYFWSSLQNIPRTQHKLSGQNFNIEDKILVVAQESPHCHSLVHHVDSRLVHQVDHPDTTPSCLGQAATPTLACVVPSAPSAFPRRLSKACAFPQRV